MNQVINRKSIPSMYAMLIFMLVDLYGNVGPWLVWGTWLIKSWPKLFSFCILFWGYGLLESLAPEISKSEKIVEEKPSNKSSLSCPNPPWAASKQKQQQQQQQQQEQQQQQQQQQQHHYTTTTPPAAT